MRESQGGGAGLIQPLEWFRRKGDVQTPDVIRRLSESPGADDGNHRNRPKAEPREGNLGRSDFHFPGERYDFLDGPFIRFACGADPFNISLLSRALASAAFAGFSERYFPVSNPPRRGDQASHLLIPGYGNQLPAIEGRMAATSSRAADPQQQVGLLGAETREHGAVDALRAEVSDRCAVSKAMAVNPLEDDLLDPLLRLLELLDQSGHIPMLAPLIERELLYRLVLGISGP
ncbi:MAG TPA: AraC family transcriptional regulator N-terminal domain-containing protein [Chthoniobacterales bacterium]